MAAKLLFGLFCWVLGGILMLAFVQLDYFRQTSEVVIDIQEPPYSFTEVFCKIFIRNTIVGFISMAGFFSAGLLTALIFIFNGFWLVFSILQAFSLGLSPGIIFFKIFFHGIFEVLGFLFLGCVGFEGFFTIGQMSKSGEVGLPKFKQVILNITTGYSLLFVAAVIETFVHLCF